MQSFVTQVVRTIRDSSGHIWGCWEICRSQSRRRWGRRIFETRGERNVGEKKSGSEHVDLTLEFISFGHESGFGSAKTDDL